jgi:hypothetical protein
LPADRFNNDLVAIHGDPTCPRETSKKEGDAARPATLVRTCQWLYGNPKDRNFCSEPALPGKPWCVLHDDICHLKTVPRNPRCEAAY